MGEFDWSCPSCGHYNQRTSLNGRKICEHCGKEDTRYLPDDDGDNPGYY